MAHIQSCFCRFDCTQLKYGDQLQKFLPSIQLAIAQSVAAASSFLLGMEWSDLTAATDVKSSHCEGRILKLRIIAMLLRSRAPTPIGGCEQFRGAS